MAGVTKKLGRPRRADLYGGHIKAAEQKIADALPELIANMLLIAKGVWVEETTAKGKRRVYQMPPDRQANEYLINRIMGKPVEVRETPDDEALDEAQTTDASGDIIDP